uniref:NADH-ubiquinone oxidoreductase chain 6 n=1 Tax=Clonostachys compactiuscula TaxID=122660 RepID=A0A8F1Y2G3_9HYPO|nr:NADH dehydrogenase subunit 6 [Clonostachys compactiuscula]
MSEKILVIYDHILSGYQSESLEFISVLALFFGAIVIIIKNPIGSLMCLIGLFGVISVYLVLAGLNFIGLSYLIVYIGAISILFLFILMLINIRTSELLSNNVNSVPLALLIIILLNYAWFQVSPQYISYTDSSDSIINSSVYTNIISEFLNTWKSMVFGLENSVANIMFVTSNNWDGYITETNHAATIGMVLYTVFNMWLLLASIILLLAMVGAIIITIK